MVALAGFDGRQVLGRLVLMFSAWPNLRIFAAIDSLQDGMCREF